MPTALDTGTHEKFIPKAHFTLAHFCEQRSARGWFVLAQEYSLSYLTYLTIFAEVMKRRVNLVIVNGSTSKLRVTLAQSC